MTKAIHRWGQAAVAVGLLPEVSADDDGVLMLFYRPKAFASATQKVGLIVIRDEAVTYAELDGHVFDSITSDTRPLNVQLADALRRRGR